MADKNLNSITFPGLPDKYKVAQVVPEYSASSTYAVGDFANHLGKIYKCTTAIATAESWTAAHWTEVFLGDEVADLKSALSDITGNQIIYAIEGAFINLGGSTTDVNSPTPSGESEYAVVSCVAGDVFTVSTSGGANGRAYGFVDVNGNILTKASSTITVSNLMLTAPENSAYFVVNAYRSHFTAYYGEKMIKKVNKAEEKIDQTYSVLNDTTFDLTMIGSSNVSSNKKTGLLSIKLDDIESYITPESYGAVGDGETDDSIAVQAAVDSDYEYVVFENSYLIKDINITKQKILFFKEGSTIKLSYYDSSKQLFHNVFTTNKKLVVYGINVTGEYNNTTVSQHNYTEPIILGDACDVFIYGSSFKNLKIANRASSPSTFSDRRGIIVTVINGGNLTVNNCTFDNLNNEEWIQCLSDTQTGIIKIVNCQFKGGTGFSRVTASAEKIIIKNNTFSDVTYNGSLINCLGVNCLLERNVIENCSVTYIFDCSESTYFTKKVVCKNNTVVNKVDEQKVGCVLNCSSNFVIIESNYIYGKSICRVDNRNITGSNNIVIIKNNILEDYYSSNEVSSANAWIPIHIIGADGKNLVVSICNNSISLSKNSVNIGQPIAIDSPTKVFIKSNDLYLAKATLTSAKYLTSILFSSDLNNASGYICDNIINIDSNDSINISQYTKTYIKYPKDGTYKVKQINNILFGIVGTLEDASNNVVI